MLHYILQTLLFQLLFLAVYDIFHKKDTFFSWNRIYLLTTPLLSLVLPFIKIDVFNNSSSGIQVYAAQLERVITVSSENLVVMGTTGSVQNPTNWWLILYCIGVGISSFLIILKLYKLNILKAIAIRTRLKNKKVVILPNSLQAFSFWNTIYLGDQLSDSEKQQILTHEIVHVDQKHSFDQIYFELLKIILWWNPLIYIYQSRVTILHEYIADEIAINTVGKKNYMEQLLNATFQTQEITFVNHFFNQSLIKKRILMLQKSKSKTIAKFKYLLLVPMIGSILIYTSCKNKTDEALPGQKEYVEKMYFEENTAETACLNKNSELDKTLDNFLKAKVGKNTEVIVNLVNLETSKIIRSAHLPRKTEYRIRHIPEGTYRLDVVYGEDYVEQQVDGECKGFFKNEKMSETGEDILDYHTVKTEKGINVPSYTLAFDLLPENSKNQVDYSHDTNTEASNKNTVPKNKDNRQGANIAKNKNNHQGPKAATYSRSEPKCANQNAKYDFKLNNYLKLTSGKNAEIIVNVVNVKTLEIVRTAYLKRNQEYRVRHIPEGKYKLHIMYGEIYVEKTTNGECSVSFKEKKSFEEGQDILDFNTIVTDKGVNVPSYRLTIDLNQKTP